MCLFRGLKYMSVSGLPSFKPAQMAELNQIKQQYAAAAANGNILWDFIHWGGAGCTLFPGLTFRLGSGRLTGEDVGGFADKAELQSFAFEAFDGLQDTLVILLSAA